MPMKVDVSCQSGSHPCLPVPITWRNDTLFQIARSVLAPPLEEVMGAQQTPLEAHWSSSWSAIYCGAQQ